MNALVKTFFQGLFAFLPVFLTVYAVYAFGDWLDRVTGALLGRVAPGVAGIPGLGIVIGVLAVFLLGVLVSSRLTRWIYGVVELPLRHLPVVRDLYSALKQLTGLLAPAQGEEVGQVVRIEHPNWPLAAIGILTRDDAAIVGAPQDRVAVYLPMSYQIGGYTVFLPRAWLTPLDLSVEAAMRGVLTGWIPEQAPRRHPPR
ncbi:MAG: DUF502 domain-containing protein [Gammaproteobacteria bacterium]